MITILDNIQEMLNTIIHQTQDYCLSCLSTAKTSFYFFIKDVNIFYTRRHYYVIRQKKIKSEKDE